VAIALHKPKKRTKIFAFLNKSLTCSVLLTHNYNLHHRSTQHNAHSYYILEKLYKFICDELVQAKTLEVVINKEEAEDYYEEEKTF